MSQTPRETAGVTTRLLFAYVRRHAGDAGVEQVLTASGVAHSLAELEDERFWCSYDDKIALFHAAGAALRDPIIARHVGESLFEEQVGQALWLVIGSLGSPQQVLRSIAKANARFTTSGVMAAGVTTASSGVVTYRLNPSKRLDRTDCDYARGILSQIPVLFGLPTAHVAHPTCQLVGDQECRYEITWAPRRFRDRFFFRSRLKSASVEPAALREQLDGLQRTVADLVSTPDLDELLQRIADRAGASVRGQRHLLAVQLENEPNPRFHSDGFTPDAAASLGAALLSGALGHPGPARITTEVRSAQHPYGWLAVEMAQDEGFLPAEQDQLDAFGRLAAAALDSATALDEARTGRQAAEALLRLGHELAREGDEVGIARRICAAVPTVLGADRSMVLVWDPATKRMSAGAVHGFGEHTARASAFSMENDEATDEVANMAVPPQQRWLTAQDELAGGQAQLAWQASVAGQDALRVWGASVVATAPIVVRGRLAATVLAIWNDDRPPRTARDIVLGQLAALSDQASTALSAARALAEARYRANHDDLTGLANRVLFTEHIEQALADGRRTGARPVVCFIDLDGFKQINDTHGHAIGDQLLVLVGERILASIRETDAAARLSGDEFGVLLRGLPHLQDAGVVASKLVEALAAPYLVGNLELKVGASIGVASGPLDGSSPDQLLIAADDAMYLAKTERGTYRVAG